VVIAQLAVAGFRKISLTLNHMAPLFSAYLGNGSRWGVELEYLLEDEPLGTAGSLRLVKNLPAQFLVMNGDLLTTLPYADLMAAHRASGAWGTIAVNQRQVNIDYGVIVTDRHHRLSKYREKPVIHYAVSMGIYVLSKRALRYVPRTGKFDMPQLMQAIHSDDHLVYCHKNDCYWQDIGRFDDYQRASEDFVKEPQRYLRPGHA
jgi:NDP-sugar pyrophosphorylase family protein